MRDRLRDLVAAQERELVHLAQQDRVEGNAQLTALRALVPAQQTEVALGVIRATEACRLSCKEEADMTRLHASIPIQQIPQTRQRGRVAHGAIIQDKQQRLPPAIQPSQRIFRPRIPRRTNHLEPTPRTHTNKLINTLLPVPREDLIQRRERFRILPTRPTHLLTHKLLHDLLPDLAVVERGGDEESVRPESLIHGRPDGFLPFSGVEMRAQRADSHGVEGFRLRFVRGRFFGCRDGVGRFQREEGAYRAFHGGSPLE